jgi:hypothetical protein
VQEALATTIIITIPVIITAIATGIRSGSRCGKYFRIPTPTTATIPTIQRPAGVIILLRTAAILLLLLQEAVAIAAAEVDQAGRQGNYGSSSVSGECPFKAGCTCCFTY